MVWIMEVSSMRVAEFKRVKADVGSLLLVQGPTR